MPTFTMLKPDGTRGDAVDYRPVTVYVGAYAERLALHRPTDRHEWIVSDPESGARVHTIKASFKGCPVTSASLTLQEAREAAKEQIPALASRIGFDKFRATLRAARDQYRAAQPA